MRNLSTSIIIRDLDRKHAPIGGKQPRTWRRWNRIMNGGSDWSGW